MKTSIQFFGQLTDITNTTDLALSDINDTSALIEDLIKRFPGLKHVKFTMAVNNNIIQQNTSLSDNDVVALMPPFSGG